MERPRAPKNLFSIPITLKRRLRLTALEKKYFIGMRLRTERDYLTALVENEVFLL
jgi:hypothetical protein